MLKRSFLLAAVAATLGGCSWFGSWFGSDAPVIKPAELTEFKATATLAKQWEAQAGSAGRYVFSPATDGDAVYAAGYDGRLVKLSLASGQEIWRVEIGQKLSSGVAAGDGLLVVGTPKGELLAFNAADGKPAWSARISGELLVPATVAGGVVAARSNDGRIALFDAAGGKQRWLDTRNLPALTLREQGYLALGEKALYAGHAGGKIAALSLANGGALWESNVALPRGATELERITDVVGTLSVDARLICASAYQGRIACFDRANGNVVWGREFSSLRGVDMDDRFVYAADEHAAVFSFDKERGTNAWKQDKLRDRRLSNPLAVAEHFVAVGDFEGRVHLLDRDTGAFAARAASDGSAINGSMIALKSGLIAQTANGAVMAFRIQ